MFQSFFKHCLLPGSLDLPQRQWPTTPYVYAVYLQWCTINHLTPFKRPKLVSILLQAGRRQVIATGKQRLDVILNNPLPILVPTPGPTALDVVKRLTVCGGDGFMMAQLLTRIGRTLPHEADFNDPALYEQIKDAIVTVGGEFESRFQVTGLGLRK